MRERMFWRGPIFKFTGKVKKRVTKGFRIETGPALSGEQRVLRILLDGVGTG